MRSLGNRWEVRQEEYGKWLFLRLINEMRMRSLVNRFAELQAGTGENFGHGLINEKGKPAWEDSSQEEGHEFRRYVYDVLRVREQT